MDAASDEGEKLRMARRFCTSCGSPLSPRTAFCTACGTQQPATRKSRAPLFIGLGCLGALLLGVIAVGGALWLADWGASTSSDWSMSSDQEVVASEFGLPRTFTVVYGEDVLSAEEDGDLDTHRVEFWDYYEMGTRFIFRDGTAVATKEIDPLSDDVDYPALDPSEFAQGMTVDDVTVLMGYAPAASGEISSEIAEGLEMHVWDGLLSVTFENGGLVAAETAPVALSKEAGMW